MRTFLREHESSNRLRRAAVRTPRASRLRRGVVAVQVALWLTVIMGFAALTVDTGMIFNAKGEMQRTADAAALAAASRLAAHDEGDPITLAREAALEFAGRNDVLNSRMCLTTDDVEFGRAVLDPVTRQYTFVEGNTAPNAVRVSVRRTDGSPNGALPLLFARVFGRTTTNVTAESTAMLIPRDIAVVADLSGSHSDDSELRNYLNTTINLFDVWDRLPGGIDDPDGSTWNGNEFAVDGAGYNPQMAGPAWGLMKQLGYGTETIDSSYNPATDPGLVSLPYNQSWTNSTIRNSLLGQGYSVAEVNALMSSASDSSGAYENRVAVALGLARWSSGMSGGLGSVLGGILGITGNGNTNVSSNELVWSEQIMGRSMSASTALWRDYINSYMRSSSSAMTNANSAFRYRFGVKTFANYLLERKGAHVDSPELAQTPHQPMQAVKDAVGHLASTIDELKSMDHVSLEIYGTTARHEVDLTGNVYAVSDRLAEMQAGHYDPWTNIGAGIKRGIEELQSTRARPAARKVMILLTDGVANVACETCAGGDEVGGQAYTLAMTQEAISKGIQIFTVSVGSVSDASLMAEIAAMAKGETFHAAGSIEQYSARLDLIFQHLGGKRQVQLIK